MKAQSVTKQTWDMDSPEALAEFQKAAEEFTRQVTKSKAAARAILVKEGIHTKSGRLTKNYR